MFLLFEVIDELHYRLVISKGDHLPWRPLTRTKVFLMTECSVYRKIQLNQRICDPSNLKHIQVALFQSYAALNEAQVCSVCKKYHQICWQFCFVSVQLTLVQWTVSAPGSSWMDPRSPRSLRWTTCYHRVFVQLWCWIWAEVGALLGLCWTSVGPRCFRAGTFSL